MTNIDVTTAVTHSALPRLESLDRTVSTRRPVWYVVARLIRFKYHASFIIVLFGAILFSPLEAREIVFQMPMLYVSFNVLLYGGLYTMNAITDLDSDARHPHKRLRPIPSGLISKRSATVLMTILLLSGLVSGFWFFGGSVLFVYLAAVALNLFYSLVARQIPLVELAVNASTHPLRLLLGAMVVNGRVPYSALAAVFFLALGFSIARRRIEQEEPGSQARHTLRFYPPGSLTVLQTAAFLALLAISIFDRNSPPIFHASLLLLSAVILVSGLDYLVPIRRLLIRVWTR